MSLKSKKILGISLTTESKKNILEYIEKYLEKSSKKPFVIVTPNPEQIVAAQEDPHFAKILNQSDVAIPDGIGLAFVIKQKRIPGVEFMEDLVKLAAKRGYPIGLIGGRVGVAVEALECLSRRTSGGLRGWTFEPGEIDLGNLGDLGDLCEKIQKTNTRFVFVGLGAPKQEYLIEQLRERVMRDEGWGSRNNSFTHSPSNSSFIFMSVGGAFDMIAGRTARAPWILRCMGLEWLWRLVREPWRFRRQLALFKFLWLVVGAKLASKG